MAISIWCILATVALASAGPGVYDQGPQTFYASSTPLPSASPQPEASANREFVLYLTTDQVKALENGGAVVRPQQTLEPEIVPNGEPQVTEQENEQSNENSEEEPKIDTELEDIFKILNQQRIEEEAAEQQEEQETTEKPRDLPGRFTVSSKSQQEKNKYYAPTVAKKAGPAKSYSYLRFLPNQDSDWKLRSYQRNQGNADSQEENRSEETENENEEKTRVYLEPFLQRQSLAASIIQQRDRLAKNELSLQNKLRELQSTPKYNDQKYAIEIEKWRSELEKQNAKAKAEALAKPTSVLIKEEIVKKRRPVEVVKHVKVPVPTPVIVRVPQPYEVKIPQPYAVPVPIIKNQKVEVERPEAEKREPATVTKNVYVKLDKPYFVERLVPVERESEKQTPVEAPARKPEQLTIIRHIWEH